MPRARQSSSGDAAWRAFCFQVFFFYSVYKHRTNRDRGAAASAIRVCGSQQSIRVVEPHLRLEEGRVEGRVLLVRLGQEALLQEYGDRLRLVCHLSYTVFPEGLEAALEVSGEQLRDLLYQLRLVDRERVWLDPEVRYLLELFLQRSVGLFSTNKKSKSKKNIYTRTMKQKQWSDLWQR